MYGGGINMLQYQPYSDLGTMVHDRMDNGVIITLRGTDNRAQISIPQLQKQFSTAGIGDEVQFIVKSFSFHTEFINLKKGDGFNFWLTQFDIQPANDPASFPISEATGSRALEPFSIPLLLETDLPEIHVTTDEFILILNRSKLYALQEFASIHNPGFVPGGLALYNQSMVFNILMNSEFVYDYTVGKIGLSVVFENRVQMYYTTPTLYTTDTFVNFSLLMQPFSNLTSLNQYRLAQLMGFGSNVDTTIASMATAIYEYTFKSPVMELYLFHPIGVNLNYYPPNREKTLTMFAPYVSDNLPNKFVIIRSSARSNVVSDKGKREGILLSIAVTQSSIETYQTFNEDKLDFASKDTLQGVKAMSLEIVDEFNQPLTFRTPYELKIGVYFK